MLQRGDYAPEICYFMVVHASSFSLQPVPMYYSLLISSLFTLALASDIAFVFYRVVHNVVFNACTYLCMYVKYTLVCIPHRDICCCILHVNRSGLNHTQ